uniref:Uncharacterized protein n=1 Tax=Parascaris equorum TaxID=6256 RepID=A0A914SIS2_PAREQ
MVSGWKNTDGGVTLVESSGRGEDLRDRRGRNGDKVKDSGRRWLMHLSVCLSSLYHLHWLSLNCITCEDFKKR